VVNKEISAIRLGRPWIGYCVMALMIGSFSAVAYTAYSLISVGPNKFGGFPWINGLLIALIAALDFSLIFLVLRHPTKLARVIRLTNTELQLPDPKWRHVPISDVAGVGLARYQPVLGSKRKGMWAPIFWQRDGTHLRVGGVGLTVSTDSPEQSKIADTVCEVYRRISAAQGPTGLLVGQALQSKANLRVTESIVDIWDPSSHLSIRDAV
jgi:hypothetical protein